MIIDHNDLTAMIQHQTMGAGRWNGAYYYSLEIGRNIIPFVYTDRDWITMKVDNRAADHCIYFVHNNLNPERYSFIKNYKDVILVCGIPETCEKVKAYGNPIYIPITIDVEEVEKFKRPKTKDVAFAGRMAKRRGNLPEGIDHLENLPRPVLLSKMAEYEKIYAVGRTALEAKALGCEVLPYDERFPDPNRWEVLDNSHAVGLLQTELDRIDGRRED